MRAVRENQPIMRGQPGPCLFPGNATAARRLTRKPPRIILWSIGIITCLLLAGAAAMLAVGYLNPFGTVGLSILGVGAAVYFGAIIFLVLSCLWVERKYPGMQPLSFRIMSRKPQRPPPTVFVNPNVSGQTPMDATQAYRIHDLPSNIPGLSDIERGMDNNPPCSNDTENNINDHQNKLPETEYILDPDNLPTITGSLQDDDANIDNSLETNTKDTGTSSAGNVTIKGKSQVQQEHLNIINDNATEIRGQTEKDFQNSQQDKNSVPTSNPQMERKHKTHHIEIPPEDYPSPDNSTSTHNNTKGPPPQDVSPHSNQAPENNNSQTTGDSATVTYSEVKTTAAQQRKTNKKSVSFQTFTTDQTSVENNSTLISQTQQNSSHPSNTVKERPFEKDIKAQDLSQTVHLQRTFAVKEKKQIESHPSKNTHNNSSKKSTDSKDIVADSKGDLPSLAKNLESPESSKKMQSTEELYSLQKGIQSRNYHQPVHSPPNIRKMVNSSPTTRHQPISPNNSPKVQRTKDHVVAMPSISLNKEGIYKTPSSQVIDPSSNLSSPTRQRTRSPNVSPQILKHQITPSGTATSHFNEAKEEFEQSRQSQQHLASYSSEASPPSPHQSPAMQRRKGTSTNNIENAHTSKDGLHKKLSQRVSQSSDITLSPTTSPLSARKLLQFNLEQSHEMTKPTKSQQTKDQATETSGAR